MHLDAPVRHIGLANIFKFDQWDRSWSVDEADHLLVHGPPLPKPPAPAVVPALTARTVLTVVAAWVPAMTFSPGARPETISASTRLVIPTTTLRSSLSPEGWTTVTIAARRLAAAFCIPGW